MNALLAFSPLMNKKIPKAQITTLKNFESIIKYGEPDIMMPRHYGTRLISNNDLVGKANDGHVIVYLDTSSYKFNKEKRLYIYDCKYPGTSEITNANVKLRLYDLWEAISSLSEDHVYGVFTYVKSPDLPWVLNTITAVRPVPNPLHLDLVEGTVLKGFRIVLSGAPMTPYEDRYP